MANRFDCRFDGMLSTGCLLAAVLLAQALSMRDDAQKRLHKRDVAPALQRCKVQL